MHKNPTCRHLFSTLLLGSFAFAYAGTGAQTTTPAATLPPNFEAVASPTAYAPPMVYRSVFADTPTGIDSEETDWKKANVEVGSFKRGHMDVLRWENAQPEAQPKTTKSIAIPATKSGAKP